jgi:membrane-bound metal-dependent hydrolase YbcI (DUF457 family)
MDLFTHVLLAYLLSFVLWGPAAPQYIAAGALAGGLPDGDILLFPLARRWPSLEHRGIVHTILGVTVIASVGCVLVPHLPYFRPASTLDYWIAMEIGGLSHLALDGFTHYAVAPLEPFSRRELRLDADVAVSVVTLGMTAVAMAVLVAERGRVVFGLWLETTWLLIAVYAGYLALRWAARTRARRVGRREGFAEVLPTTNPWKWTLLDEADGPGSYRIRFRPLTLGRAAQIPERRLEVAKLPPTAGPVGSAQEALDRTYLAALGKSRWLGYRSRFGEAEADGDVYRVRWYVVETAPFGRTYGVHGAIDRRTGAIDLRTGFFRTGGPGPWGSGGAAPTSPPG